MNYKRDKMWLAVGLLLTASGVSSLGRNMSALRLGKTRLLEDLRAQSAFRDKVGPCGDDNAVNLTFNYRHFEVLSLNEVEETVTSVGFVQVMWADPDLTWDKADYGGVDRISLPLEELWHPTVIVHNAVDPDYVMIDRIESLMLGSDGVVQYATPVFLKTTCNLDLKRYPFDDQTCDIVFVPFIDDVYFNIYSTILGGRYEDITTTGQWDTISTSIVTSVITQEGGIQVISFSMVLQRKYMYYIVCVIIPMILISSMTSIVFWIPPSSGEKISFLVTVFASNAVLLNFIAAAMPTNMANNVLNLPRVTIFLILVNLQCMLAMILTVFVLRKYNNEQEETLASGAHDISKQTEQNNLAPKNNDISAREDSMAVGKASYSTSDRLAAFLFRKLAFLKPRVAPSERGKNESPQRAQKRCRCGWRSSTWDLIFFCLFHFTTGPVYYLLFKM